MNINNAWYLSFQNRIKINRYWLSSDITQYIMFCYRKVRLSMASILYGVEICSLLKSSFSYLISIL